MARTKPRDENLAGDLNRIILVTCFVEGFLDAVDDSVAHGEIRLRNLLVLVDFADQLFNDAKLFLSLVAVDVNADLLVLRHHIVEFVLLLFLDLLPVALEALLRCLLDPTAAFLLLLLFYAVATIVHIRF